MLAQQTQLQMMKSEPSALSVEATSPTASTGSTISWAGSSANLFSPSLRRLWGERIFQCLLFA